MHFLRQIQRDVYPQVLGKPHLGHVVRVTGVKTLRLDLLRSDNAEPVGLFILCMDTQVAKLPEDVTVCAPDGTSLQSSFGGFYVTTETLDPYHIVCDGLPGAEIGEQA